MAFPTTSESISLDDIVIAYGKTGITISPKSISALNGKFYYDAAGTQYTIAASPGNPFSLGTLRGKYATDPSPQETFSLPITPPSNGLTPKRVKITIIGAGGGGGGGGGGYNGGPADSHGGYHGGEGGYGFENNTGELTYNTTDIYSIDNGQGSSIISGGKGGDGGSGGGISGIYGGTPGGAGNWCYITINGIRQSTPAVMGGGGGTGGDAGRSGGGGNNGTKGFPSGTGAAGGPGGPGSYQTGTGGTKGTDGGIKSVYWYYI